MDGPFTLTIHHCMTGAEAAFEVTSGTTAQDIRDAVAGLDSDPVARYILISGGYAAVGSTDSTDDEIMQLVRNLAISTNPTLLVSPYKHINHVQACVGVSDAQHRARKSSWSVKPLLGFRSTKISPIIENVVQVDANSTQIPDRVHGNYVMFRIEAKHPFHLEFSGSKFASTKDNGVHVLEFRHGFPVYLCRMTYPAVVFKPDAVPTTIKFTSEVVCESSQLEHGYNTHILFQDRVIQFANGVCGEAI